MAQQQGGRGTGGWPAARSAARTAVAGLPHRRQPQGPPSRCSTRHGGGAGPEEREAGESVGQELGGALHHRRRLGRDAVPVDAVWGGRRRAGGGGGMEVEMGSKRQGRAGRWDFLSYFLSSDRFGADLC